MDGVGTTDAQSPWAGPDGSQLFAYTLLDPKRLQTPGDTTNEGSVGITT
jgi:hypothetical protein